ncbi:MAG: alpha/beta fold hydrolase [Gemmatimonadota bacterium]
MDTNRTRARIDGFRLHALHAGAGEPVVLLHGLSGSRRWWRYNTPTLARAYRVHVPEMVGFGHSRGAVRHPTLPEMAGLLVRWLDALEIERAHFVGHSMGAQVGVHLASRWPERIERLVLTDAAGVPHPLSRAQLVAVAGELVRPRSWGRMNFLPTIAADTLRTGPRTVVRALRGILADDIRPLLPRVRAPTLLLWGEHDPITPLEDGRMIADLVPDAELVVIRGASHNPMADQPAAFNRELLRFLEGDGRRATPIPGLK